MLCFHFGKPIVFFLANNVMYFEGIDLNNKNVQDSCLFYRYIINILRYYFLRKTLNTIFCYLVINFKQYSKSKALSGFSTFFFAKRPPLVPTYFLINNFLLKISITVK